jgi:hypothetical protein
LAGRANAGVLMDVEPSTACGVVLAGWLSTIARLVRSDARSAPDDDARRAPVEPRTLRESMVSPGPTSDGVTKANIGAGSAWIPTPFQRGSGQVRGGT